MNELQAKDAGHTMALHTILAQCVAKANGMDTAAIKTAREEIYRILDTQLMSGDPKLQFVRHAIYFADEIFSLSDLIARTPREPL